jgi:shikimate dehydrogenase
VAQAPMRVAGVIGHPVAHSRSPAMQQAAFDALGMAARYELWDTPPEQLATRVAGLRAPEVLGANVTIPHKTTVLPLLDAVAPSASPPLAAVNTIVREESAAGVRLVGHNTDVPALLRVLAEQSAWAAGRRMLVLGAGGAARAALAVARLEGAEVTVAARRVEGARAALAALAPAHVLDLAETDALAAALAGAHILVNTTPVGMRAAEASPLPLELLRQLSPASFVFDMIYSPPETALVRAARALGLRAQGGLPMLLYQGALAFALWTGREPPLDAMRAALVP